MCDSSYTFKLNEFEGPLELLCSLIEKRKLQINTISLASITGEYLLYIKNTKEQNLPMLSEFVYFASILILIKAKSLMPILEYTKQEEINIEVLQTKINTYKYIKQKISPRLEVWNLSAYKIKGYEKIIEKKFSPGNNCTKKNIENIFLNVNDSLIYLSSYEKKVMRKSISIDVMIKNILTRINEKIKISFASFNELEKQNIILAFLAILELFKDEVLFLEQTKNFDEILIAKNVI